MADLLRVSVVINTLNRASSLAATLAALRRLDYPYFEVIVVNGPSEDGTAEVLEAHSPYIRAETCSSRNLSTSRNVGIEMSRGDLVGFLDDDAVPDESWLNDVVAAFDSEEVGGAGGFVFDHTGYNLQYRYSLCNRLGNARWNVSYPGREFCYPGCSEFPYLQGTNAVFRRSALVEVGGFDEEFDYYLDETDVCLRLVDAGYLIKQLANAFVYHRYLPSHIRQANHVVTNWQPIIKNKVYFSLKNSPPETPFRVLMEDWRRFVDQSEANLRYHVEHGNAPPDCMRQFERDADTGLRDGVLRGLGQNRRLRGALVTAQMEAPLVDDVFTPADAGEFKPYPTVLPESERLTVCYLSQEYPPGVVGGIGRLTWDLARGLAALGHRVHVLTRSASKANTVDFEDGVWVHRLICDRTEPTPPPDIEVPAHIWQHSARLLRELHRIHAMHPIDIVEAPIWDTEGLATVVAGSFRVVTNLETPLKVWRETNPELASGSAAERQFFALQEAAETLTMRRSTACRAISAAIVQTMEKLYGVHFSPERLYILPLGMEDRSLRLVSGHHDGSINVLFAGRFERRKGVDVLLEVIPLLCAEFPTAKFILVGDDRPNASGNTLRTQFEVRHAGAHFLHRIIFAGKVSDGQLESCLAQSDIFVAPSRYESFGLVFLEAMMFGKPTVGCRAGGVPEVIEEGVTGLLAEPGDAESLRAALASLLADPARRQAMGRAGRERFLTHYTQDCMSQRTVEFYRHVLALPPPRAVEAPVSAGSVAAVFGGRG